MKAINRRGMLRLTGALSLAAYSGSWAAETFSDTGVPRGYGADPPLSKRAVTWSPALTRWQMGMLTALCDVVLPVDPPHPSAVAVGVHEFLAEWLSAPYPRMRADRKEILAGIEVLEQQTAKKLGASFARANRFQQIEEFDAFHRISPRNKACALRLIDLVCAGYYTTREGHAAIGYVGNVPLSTFHGPNPQIVRTLEAQLQALPGGITPVPVPSRE